MQSATPQGLFGCLFRQVSWHAFSREYWAKRPLHIQDCRELTGALPGMQDFPALVAGVLNADRWDQSSSELQCSFLDASSAVRTMKVPAGQWAHAYNAGLSLCFGAVHRWHPRLGELIDECQRLSRRSEPVFVSAYLTPKRSGGPMHFDSQHVFFLQVAGQKHWRISKAPAAVGPMRNVMASEFSPGETRMTVLGVEVRHPDSCEMEDIVLREGDALYLPPGTWHAARTLEAASLHYTLSLLPVSFATIMSQQLHELTAEHPAWRMDLRYVDPEGDLAQLLAARLEEMRALLEKVTAAKLANAKPPHLLERETASRHR